MYPTNRAHVVLALALACALPACRRSGPPEPGSGELAVPEDMVALLPADTLAYLHLVSLEQVDALVARLSAVGEEEPDASTDPRAGLLAFGVDPATIDPARPLGAAINLPAPGVIGVTLILPALDPETLAQGAAPSTAVRGDYVGWSTWADYQPPAAKSSFARDMIGGTVSVRVDVGAAIERVRPLIDAQLDTIVDAVTGAELEGLESLEPLAQAYVDGFRACLDSAGVASLGMGIDGDLLHVVGALDVLEGSPLATLVSTEPSGLSGLVDCVRGDEALVVLGGMDLRELMTRMQPFVEAAMGLFADAGAPGLQEYLQRVESMYGLFGTALVSSVELGGGRGMRTRSYFASDDPGQLVAAYEDLLQSDALRAIGLEVGEPQRSEVEGVAVTTFVFDFDAAAVAQALDADPEEVDTAFEEVLRAVYGESPRFSLATVKGTTVMTVGGDEAFVADAIARVRAGPATLPRLLRTVVEEVGDQSPSLVAYADLGRFVAMVAELVAEVAPQEQVPDLSGVSAHLAGYATAADHTWRAGILVGLDGLAELIGAMDSPR